MLKIQGLKKRYKKGVALRGVDLEIPEGEIFGLVGESGSGKSTLARCILRLITPSEGSVTFCGHDLLTMPRKNLARLGQIVFQDPLASLNPRMTVLDIIGEGLDIHKLATGQARTRRVAELLNMVGLNPRYMERYPHEFSGGQRQRIGIARALSVNPKLLICDEAVSALDLSIQAQVLNLLKDLQKQMGLTYLFIAHDLAVVRCISDRVGVMHQGKLVEVAPTESLFTDPQHPYTQTLISAGRRLAK